MTTQPSLPSGIMTEPVYRADPPSARVSTEVEGLALVYHRASGLTHILAPPGPELLDALAEGEASAAELLARLARDHDLAPSADALGEVQARLDELVISGLIWLK